MNEQIMIIIDGCVQVRVRCYDEETEDYVDMWLDTITKGGCFNVYSPFCHDCGSLVTYMATKPCNIDVINLSNLENEAVNIIELKQILQSVREKVKFKHVNDIDFFKFPSKYLEEYNVGKTDQQLKAERSQYLEKRKEM